MVPEPEFFRRVRAALQPLGVAENASNAVAKGVFDALWMLVCDAKVRRRRADGTLITAEQEAEEQRVAEVALGEKAKMWAEREAHMKSDLVGYDGKPL